ncbi:hypothetical protein D9M71_514680 [compost metagenome]
MPEGIEDFEIRRLALLALGVDEKALALGKEPGLDPGLIELRVLEVAQYVGGRGVAHGPAMVGVLPLFGLLGVTAKAGGSGNITLGRSGLRGRRSRRRVGPGRDQRRQHHQHHT